MKTCKGCVSTRRPNKSNYCLLYHKYTNKRCSAYYNKDFYNKDFWNKVFLVSLLLLLLALLTGCDCKTKEAYHDIFPIIDECNNDSEYVSPEVTIVNTPGAI